MRSADAGSMSRDEFEESLALAIRGTFVTDTGASESVSNALIAICGEYLIVSEALVQRARDLFDAELAEEADQDSSS
jgi:hypothetical protein